MSLRREALSIESLTKLVGSERTLWLLLLMEKCLYVCDAYMQTCTFMLSLRTRVLKNNPRLMQFMKRSLSESAITSEKTTLPSSAFLACGRCLGHTTCFATQALSWVSVPSRQSGSNPRRTVPLRHGASCTLCRETDFVWYCQLGMK